MLAAIDLSPEEISELTLAHEQEKEQTIETPDYGNLVTGEGSQYEWEYKYHTLSWPVCDQY